MKLAGATKFLQAEQTESSRTVAKSMLKSSSKPGTGPEEPAVAPTKEEHLDLPSSVEHVDGELVPEEVHEAPEGSSMQAEPLSAEAGIDAEDTSFLYDNPMDSQDASADNANSEHDMGESDAQGALCEMVDMLILMDTLQALGVGVIEANRVVASILRSSPTLMDLYGRGELSRWPTDPIGI